MSPSALSQAPKKTVVGRSSEGHGGGKGEWLHCLLLWDLPAQRRGAQVGSYPQITRAQLPARKLGLTLLQGAVIVIRYEGPKGGPGMPEMLTPTSAIIGAGLGDHCALITDGRFSGGSHGFVIGHITPEAQEGGPIALVRVAADDSSGVQTPSYLRLTRGLLQCWMLLRGMRPGRTQANHSSGSGTAGLMCSLPCLSWRWAKDAKYCCGHDSGVALAYWLQQAAASTYTSRQLEPCDPAGEIGRCHPHRCRDKDHQRCQCE